METKPKGRLSIEDLERLLDGETGDDWDSHAIEILPNGEIRCIGGSTEEETAFKKPITLREDLGGEYAQTQAAA